MWKVDGHSDSPKINSGPLRYHQHGEPSIIDEIYIDMRSDAKDELVLFTRKINSQKPAQHRVHIA